MRLRPIIPLHLGLSLLLAFFFWSPGALPECFGAPEYKLLKSFGNPDRMGVDPNSTPIQASDGMLYGMAFGGRNKSGVIYRTNADGSGYHVIYHFGPPPPPGTTNASRPVYPAGRLLEADDGRLYGVAANAGAAYGGAIFRLEKSGEGFQALRTYPIGGTQPTNPWAGLIQGTDGLLYGTTTESGPNAPATIFRMGLDGGNYQVLYTMGRSAGAPRSTFDPLFEGSDGFLYGTSRFGGEANGGVLYKLRKDGSDFEVIHSFSHEAGNGHSPWGGVIEGSDGALYGTVEYGGAGGGGGAYRIARDGSEYKLLCQFVAAVGELRRPRGELVESPDGFLYGAASESPTENFSNLPGGVFRVRKDGTGFEVSARLAQVTLAQGHPVTGLVLASDGSLLGVAGRDGSSNSNAYQGFLYRLSAVDRTLSIPHRFSESGGEPSSSWSIFEASDGRFYGYTNSSDFSDDLFSLRRDGQEAKVLFQFDDGTNFGRHRGASLCEGMDGRFYSVSRDGGTAKMGAVTRIDASGENLTLLHSFAAEPATAPKDPWGGVIQASDGFFYGTTKQGGRREIGTVFRMAADGSDFTVIHEFQPSAGVFAAGGPVMQLLEGSDGALHGMTEFGCFRLNKDGTGYQFTDLPRNGVTAAQPRGPFIEGSDGVLYGTASQGGTAGRGIVFKINQDGSGFAVLSEFTTANGAPYYPVGALAEGVDGALYGVSLNGGTRGSGTLFSLNKDGTGFTRLRSFGGGSDGLYPSALVRSGDGLLYGVTQYGGEYNFGTFFRYGEAPEISVEDAEGVDLVSGDSRVEWGEVQVGTAKELELTIKNTGQLPLEGLRVTVDGPQGSDFAAGVLASDSIAPGAYEVLKVTFSPQGVADRAAILRIESNDYDENPFVITLSGVGVAPDIAVRDGEAAGSPELEDGQSAPVHFGQVRVVGQIERAFAIANTGNAPLRIESIAVPQGFVLRAPTDLPATIAPGEVLGMTVRLEAAVPGVFSGVLSIVSDDPDESSFEFPVAGEGVSPEIAVHNGPDTASPELASGQAAAVDFGRVVQGTIGGAASKAVTIANTGTAPLAVSSIRVPPGYTLLAEAEPTIAPGGSGTWILTLTSSEPGIHAGSVVISSDDLDEAEFVFPVTGEIYIPDPVVSVVQQETVLNRQTGLREQTIRVVNDTTATVPAYRLLIPGLPAGVTVANATEVRADGTVVVLVRQPLAPFASFDLVLEYASANRQPVVIDPLIITEAVLVPPDDAAGEGTAAFEIERAVWLPEADGLLLEFGSVPERLYAVEYSDDGVAWKTSPVSVRGAGNRTQWIDRGPPRTVSPPGAQPLRFYRVCALVD